MRISGINNNSPKGVINNKLHHPLIFLSWSLLTEIDKDGKKDFTEHNGEGHNVLLFGSEGYGLKYQTLQNSDFLLKIHINKKIESLNISNSAAVVFHYINNLRKKN